MARLSILVLLAALLYVHTSEGRSFQSFFSQVGEETKRLPFDKLALVLTWPPSYCQKMCVKPSSDYRLWTIHGLWPFKSGVHSKNLPTYCPGKYDSALIQGSFRNELNQKWPNLNGGSNDKFWKHEFEKHGMCPFDPSVFTRQQQYFQDASHLYDEYNIKTILQNGGIVPSTHNVYKLADIQLALHRGLGVHPAVYCYEMKGIQFLLEVRMCFDTNLRPITCGDDLVGGGRCNPLKQIFYSPTEIKVTRNVVGTSADSDVQFLLDIAEMDTRDLMVDEGEDDDAELWENF